MATFSFYIDQKCSIWQRGRFDIQAETYEQAKEFVIEKKLPDNIEWETLWHTIDTIDVRDNNEQPTFEIYSDDYAGKLVQSNKPL